MEEEKKSKKMTTVLKQRDSNLELYRIIVMLSIVAHHYVVNSGLIDLLKEAPLSTRSIFYYLFGAWGKTGINCFVLITGYYMCKSNITLRKYLKLFFEVLFYSIVINATLIFFGKEQVTLEGIWRNLQIFFDLSYGFTSCFLMFYLFIPFLNILVRNMKRGQHFNLIMLCLIIYTGISTFVLGKVEMNYVVWFSILFIISSYIRLYEPMQKVPWGGVCLGGGHFCLL